MECFFVGGWVVRWEGGKGERMMRWQGGKGGRLMRWQDGKDRRIMRWQGGKGGKVVRWQRWQRWESGEAGRWEVPGSIQGWGTQRSPRFLLFVSDVNQRNEGAGWVQNFLTIIAHILKKQGFGLYKIALNYLLSPFLMLFILLILTRQNLNTVLFNYI